jgi:chaperonin GroEL (HSP60 family)
VIRKLIYLCVIVCLGGGVTLLYASQDFDKLPTANFDKKVGVQIIQNALKVPRFFLLEQWRLVCRY